MNEDVSRRRLIVKKPSKSDGTCIDKCTGPLRPLHGKQVCGPRKVGRRLHGTNSELKREDSLGTYVRTQLCGSPHLGSCTTAIDCSILQASLTILWLVCLMRQLC